MVKKGLGIQKPASRLTPHSRYVFVGNRFAWRKKWNWALARSRGRECSLVSVPCKGWNNKKEKKEKKEKTRSHSILSMKKIRHWCNPWKGYKKKIRGHHWPVSLAAAGGNFHRRRCRPEGNFKKSIHTHISPWQQSRWCSESSPKSCFEPHICSGSDCHCLQRTRASFPFQIPDRPCASLSLADAGQNCVEKRIPWAVLPTPLVLGWWDSGPHQAPSATPPVEHLWQWSWDSQPSLHKRLTPHPPRALISEAVCYDVLLCCLSETSGWHLH